MKKKTILGIIITLLFILAIIGLMAKSVILGTKIIFVIVLLVFGLKAIFAVKAFLKTFLSDKKK